MQTKNSTTRPRSTPPLLTDGHVPSLGHLLLAEIDPVVARALQDRLTRSGYNVTVMESGMEARWSLFSTRYDALIVSLDHPNCAGLDLLDDVSKHRRLPPVIALSSTEGVAVEDAQDFGATCVYGTSSRTQDITDALHRLLG